VDVESAIGLLEGVLRSNLGEVDELSIKNLARTLLPLSACFWMRTKMCIHMHGNGFHLV